MIYETRISVVVVDENGNEKTQKRAYILENASSFSDAEHTLENEFGNETGFEVNAIKISKLREIINEAHKGDSGCKIYFATIIDKFYDSDKDETTETKYTVALYAHDINEAHSSIKQYMLQGLEDMELVAIKETKYFEVI